MFQTEINIFFQSFASDFLTTVFKFFSFIGSGGVIVPLLIVITFGVHFRYGTLLIHLSFWNGVITDFLKNVFALPRPFNVDSAVQLPGEGIPNPTPFKGMGGKSFFGCLPGQVVEYFREHGVWVDGAKSFGLPSGHTSSAVALWGAVFLFFKGPASPSPKPLRARHTWVSIITIIFIVFIPLSRLYLGYHFLADVAAGFLLGFTLLLLFYKFVFLLEKKTNFFTTPCLGAAAKRLIGWVRRTPAKRLIGWGRRPLFEKIGAINLKLILKSFLLAVYFLLTPFLLLLIPGINPLAAPTLLGMNCGFLLLWLRGLPKEGGTLLQRSGRVLIAVVFYFGINMVLKGLTGCVFSAEPRVIEFIRQALSISLLFYGTAEVCIKLKFYRR